MKFKIATLMISLLFLLGCKSKNNYDQSIIGQYDIYGFNMRASLNLNDDNTFSHKVDSWFCMGGGDSEEYIGTYSILNNEIIFKPSYFIKSTHFDDDSTEVESFDYSQSIHQFRDTLNIVQYNNHVYLLSEDNLSLWGNPYEGDFLRFVNDVNSGYNDKQESGSYWSKKRHYTDTATLDNIIPIPWKNLLLDQIIEAQVISVEPYESSKTFERIKSIVTIDQGKEKGVKIGMEFYADEKQDCACDLVVFEVMDKVSKGYTDICGPNNCIIDTKISTFLKREVN